MNIGIDIDDTIANTSQTTLAYAHKYVLEVLKRPIQMNEYTGNSIVSSLKTLLNWTTEEIYGFWEKHYEIIIKETTPKEFASETIKQLSKNNKIILITSRLELFSNKIEDITKEWLKKNDIYYDKLIMNAEDKLKPIKENDIKLFIDDNCKHCTISANANIKTLMMDTKSNEKLKDEKIIRVYTWPQIMQEYNKIKEKNNKNITKTLQKTIDLHQKKC